MEITPLIISYIWRGEKKQTAWCLAYKNMVKSSPYLYIYTALEHLWFVTKKFRIALEKGDGKGNMDWIFLPSP